MDSTTFKQIVNQLILTKQAYQNSVIDQSLSNNFYVNGKIDAYTEIINLLSNSLNK